MMRATIQTRLNTDANSAWQLVKRSDTFVRIVRGMLGVSGVRDFPDQWQSGQQINTRLWFFHFLPRWVQHLTFVSVDDDRRELETNEHGGLVPAWKHRIHVEENGSESESCLYTDEIDVRASILTPLVWLYCHVFFRYRQSRLRKLAARRTVRSSMQEPELRSDHSSSDTRLTGDDST